MNKIHLINDLYFKEEKNEILKILHDNFLYGFNNISYAICNINSKSNIAFSTNNNFINDYIKKNWIEIDTVDVFESNMIKKSSHEIACYEEIHGISKNGEKMRENRARFGMKNGGMEYFVLNEKISISIYYHTYIIDFDFTDTYIRKNFYFNKLRENLINSSKKYISSIYEIKEN